ncbi:MAG: YqhA family protein [Candidatus Aenigmarchaeota archaeon]|nr:YqhA family protein [Candidatus Aenigmarchaeota archaeon]
MEALLSKSRYLTLIAVYCSLVAATAAFLFGAYKTFLVLQHLAMPIAGGEIVLGVELISIMDIFLIATALYLFAVGTYELFIADVRLPKWLEIHNLHDLKTKMGGVIILVMGVTFLEHLVYWENAADTLMFGASIFLVIMALIAFSHFGGKD